MNVFQQIRSDCQRVVKSGAYTSLELDGIDRIIPILTPALAEPPAHSEPHHLLYRGKDTVAYFLILDAVNFGSGYFPYIRKQPGMSGYFTVAQALKGFCLRNGIPSPSYLQSLTAKGCAEIFGQDLLNHASRDLMGLFANALNQLGDLVSTRYSGRYENILLESEGKAAELVRRLAEMPFFKDVERYEGRPVRFFKRAQIFVQDVVLAEPNNDLTRFADIDELTAFADNVIPFVLRCEQILKLEPELEQRIEREEEIYPGSMEEVELRASAIVATELIAKKFASKGRRVPERIVDFLLWNHGQKLKGTCALHRHRTPCVYY